jgi:hypothetical protein
MLGNPSGTPPPTHSLERSHTALMRGALPAAPAGQPRTGERHRRASHLRLRPIIALSAGGCGAGARFDHRRDTGSLRGGPLSANAAASTASRSRHPQPSSGMNSTSSVGVLVSRYPGKPSRSSGDNECWRRPAQDLVHHEALRPGPATCGTAEIIISAASSSHSRRRLLAQRWPTIPRLGDYAHRQRRADIAIGAARRHAGRFRHCFF